jgi:MscS family membrane protein
MDALLLQLETLLTNRYWRVIFILALAGLVALLLRIFVLPLLNRLSRRTSSKIDDQLLARINPAVLRTVVLEGLHWAIIDYLHDESLHFMIHGLVVTLLVLIWGRVALECGTIIFRRASEQTDRKTWIQPSTLPLIQFGFKVVVFGTQAYLIMTAWNINLTSWLASAGVVGIAVGFAAKDTLANFISGVFILIDAPYSVGQYIIIDNQTRGVVTDIGMRSTRLLTRDNVEVTVPNAVIGNAMVVNESSGPSTHMRVRVSVSVPYGSDVDEVKDLLLSCAQDVPYTAGDREAAVRFDAMGDSALMFTVRVWVEYPEFRGRVIDTLNTRIYKALGQAGIEIPFPQQDIHVKSWPEMGAPPIT